MNYLISLAMLFLMSVPQDQKLPGEFYQIPEHVRAEATIIIAGTYAEGRSPCIFMPDGSRRWALESSFQVTKVYRGKVGGKSIHIKSRRRPKTEDASERLEVGHKYLVLLRPGDESRKLIEEGEYVPFRDALRDEEVVAVVELK